MLELSQEQVEQINSLENQEYLHVLRTFILKENPELTDEDVCMDKMVESYEFAISLNFESSKLISQFITLCVLIPDFYKIEGIKEWLTKSGDSVDQRFKDLQAIMNNQMNRIG